MKHTITFILAIAFAINSSAQPDSKYSDAMKRNISVLDTATLALTLQTVANNFERIATAEKTQWLPYYYAGYAIARTAYVTENKDKIDAMLDKADAMLNMADSLSPNNSEIYVAKSMAASARIEVNPMARGAQYGPAAGMLVDQAIKLDPNNPRAYLQKGTGVFYTPAAFGGGKDKAKTILETASQKFEKFKPADDLAPNWGKEWCKRMLEQCSE